MADEHEVHHLPPDPDGDLNPDDREVVEDVMEIAGCSEERAREFLERFIETRRQLSDSE
jgi:UBA-like protein